MYTISLVDVKKQCGLTPVVDQVLASPGRDYRSSQRPTAKPGIES